MKLHWLWISALLAGCSAQSPLELPASAPTMLEIFERHAMADLGEGSQRESDRSNKLEKEPLTAPATSSRRVRVIHIYVYPHISPMTGMEIPGYWRAIPLRSKARTVMRIDQTTE